MRWGWGRSAVPVALLIATGTPSCTPVPPPADHAPADLVLELGDEDADLLWDPATAPPPLRPGRRPPAIALRDWRGEEISLETFRGRAVVLTFFETRAAAPSLCSELLARLERLQRAVPDGVWDRLHLLSVSVDPAWDTPTRLAAEARRLGADPTRWTLATADELAVRRLAAAFRVARWRRPDGSVGHTLGTAVLDRRGRLARSFAGTASWSDGDLLAATIAAVRD